MDKEQLAAALDMTPEEAEQSMRELAGQGLLTIHEDGTFTLNPEAFRKMGVEPPRSH